MEKKLSTTITEIQATHPQATVEVWSQDEARLGLFTALRRVWGRFMLNGGADTSGQPGLGARVTDAQAVAVAPKAATARDSAATRRPSRHDPLFLPPSQASVIAWSAL